MEEHIKDAMAHKASANTALRQQALEHLHEELYQILAEIQRVCAQLGLHPFLQGGSAIGAYFDKGIVPWDDDIDVGLKREEYEAFIRKAPEIINPEYFIQCADTENDMPMVSLLKVRRNGTYFQENIWDDLPLHHGIFVDIMPYDKVPDNKCLQAVQRYIANKLENAVSNSVIWRHYFKRRLRTSSREDFIYSLKSCLWATFFCRRLCRRLYNCVSGAYNSKDCAFYNQVRQKRDHIAVISLNELESVPFGPLTSYIPSGVDTYLRHHYPNLRRTLPVEERESHMPRRIEFSDGSVFEEETISE